jgi:glucose-1-phosphate adenylyltransferase
VRRAIIDKGVSVPPHAEIGFDPGEDRRRFHLSDEGIVVVQKGARID